MNDIASKLMAFTATTPLPVMMLAKATLIFILGACVAFVLRRVAASARYAAWALTLAAALALPLGVIATPAWQMKVTVAATGTPNVSNAAEVDASGSRSSAIPNNVAAGTAASLDNIGDAEGSAAPLAQRRAPFAIWDATGDTTRMASLLMLSIWLLGLFAVAGRMVIGRLALDRIVRRAATPDDTEWMGEIARQTHVSGVKNDVRVLISREVTTPLAAGISSPVLLLPEDAWNWHPSHRRVVLQHELAHVASRDSIVCIVAGLACAVYWFHPLAWIAARRMRTEQERACDDRVLSLGTPPADYATHLLEVARTARSFGVNSLVSMAMARPSQLEGRLLAVLDESQSRIGFGRRRLLTASFMTLSAVVLISAFQPVASQAAVVIGSQGNANSVVLPPVAAAAAPAVSRSRDSSVTREIAVASGGTVDLDLRTGAGITITSWDQPRLRMRATLGGPDWRETRLTLEPDGSGARITTRHEGRSRSHSTSHRIELTVPRRFNVRIASAGGGLDIRNVEGEFTGTTGGGEILIDRARGHASLSTGGGPVTVTRSTLSGSVGTGGGPVLLQEIEGGLRGHSGSGNVIYGEKGVSYSEADRDGTRRASDGRLIVRKSGGKVNLAEAPNGASVTTGGGAITIGRSGGDVVARTGGGAITIGPVSGRAEAHTGAGDVTITIGREDAGEVHVTSGKGTVTLIVPKGLSANLELETAYTNNRRSATRIESDWPLSISETRDWDGRDGTPRRYVRARQEVGGGGRRIRVRTVNGDIVIRQR